MTLKGILIPLKLQYAISFTIFENKTLIFHLKNHKKAFKLTLLNIIYSIISFLSPQIKIEKIPLKFIKHSYLKKRLNINSNERF